MCYTTLVTSRSLAPRDRRVVWRTLSENPFEEVGFVQDVPALLPDVLKDLLKARKDVRAEMATTKDPFVKMVLNMRQLAIKIVCNTTYGFVGAAGGYLPALLIARAVTATGRWMIETCKNTVEQRFANSVVRYGDTDSVFMEFDTSAAPQQRPDLDPVEAQVREAYRFLSRVGP